MNILILTPGFPKDRHDPSLHFLYLEIKYLLERFGHIKVFVFTKGRTEIKLDNLEIISYQAPAGKKEYLVSALKFLAGFRMTFLSYLLRGPGKIKRFIKTIYMEMQIRQVIEKYHIDIVHSHFAFPDGCAGVLANRGNIPHVITLRGVDIAKSEELDYGLRRNRFYEKMLKLSLKRCDVITVASREFEKITLDFLKMSKRERIRIIPNGTIVKGFEQPRETDIPDSKIVLFAGGFHPRKGLAYLIEAAARVVEKFRDVEFRVLGNTDRKRKKNCMKRIDELGLTDKFNILGPVPPSRMDEHYKECHMLVHPALIEGFGNVIIEAMARRKPIIGFKTGGLIDIIDDGVTGFLVEKQDVAGLAEKILYLLQNPGESRTLGLQGYRKVVREYGIDKRVRAFFDLYRELIGGGT